MIEKISNYIVNNVLLSGDHLDENQREIMVFGVTRILEDVPKIVSIFFVAYLLDVLVEMTIVVVITLLYKSFIGGAHAKTNLMCFIVSFIYFLSPIFLAKYVNYNSYLLYIIAALVILFSIYVVVKIAPADTEEVPVIDKNKRKRTKIFAALSLIIITCFTAIITKNIIYIKIVIYTMFLIDIVATKPMYRMLGCKLGIESEEFKEFYK